jgi:hypothetical protein
MPCPYKGWAQTQGYVIWSGYGKGDEGRDQETSDCLLDAGRGQEPVKTNYYLSGPFKIK